MSNDWNEVIKSRNSVPETDKISLCFCVGPQNGEPRCPCQMRSLIIRDGRYIQPEVDLGPVVARNKP